MQTTSADPEKISSITQQCPTLGSHNHQTTHRQDGQFYTVYETDQIKQEHDPWQSK